MFLGRSTSQYFMDLTKKLPKFITAFQSLDLDDLRITTSDVDITKYIKRH